MRSLCVLALLGACSEAPGTPVGVSIILDIPDGVLAPRGYSAVEIVMHAPGGDIERSADLGTASAIDLDSIAPTDHGVWIEATLRNDSDAVVGYGRTATITQLTSRSEIIVPVLRPIAYVAGAVSRDADGNAQTPDVRWTGAPTTYADLSDGAALDGKSQLSTRAVLVITAGPSMYSVTQPIDEANGSLIGAAQIEPVSIADHAVGASLDVAITGAVLDGAGSDSGRALVVGTSSQLFAIDTLIGTSRTIAPGRFARVAVLTDETGATSAIAIRNRAATSTAIRSCSSTAELWWAPLDPAGPAEKLATGGFTDIATDRGRAYYVDGCTGELGELTVSGTAALRSVVPPSGGRPTALAVSNNQAYVGIENAPANTALVVVPIASAHPTGEPPRVLWSEAAQQVLQATELPGVQRLLDATSAAIAHLEVGAGGDYVALTTSAHFHGAPVPAASFPEMTIDTEELRVFAASTGGVVERYRSWCAGVLGVTGGDIVSWACASVAGQTAAARNYDHHINSMTFLFGKK